MATARTRSSNEDDDGYRIRGHNRDQKCRRPDWIREKKRTTSPRRPRLSRSETFRCRACKRMVGPTLSGGRHRNHCPVCLFSLHVDGKRPGDRASACYSLMEPVGLFARPSGEQVIVHCCCGCGLERYNRVAADDNPLAVMQLPLANPIGSDPESMDQENTA